MDDVVPFLGDSHLPPRLLRVCRSSGHPMPGLRAQRTAAVLRVVRLFAKVLRPARRYALRRGLRRFLPSVLWVWGGPVLSVCFSYCKAGEWEMQ